MACLGRFELEVGRAISTRGNADVQNDKDHKKDQHEQQILQIAGHHID